MVTVPLSPCAVRARDPQHEQALTAATVLRQAAFAVEAGRWRDAEALTEQARKLIWSRS